MPQASNGWTPVENASGWTPVEKQAPEPDTYWGGVKKSLKQSVSTAGSDFMDGLIGMIPRSVKQLNANIGSSANLDHAATGDLKHLLSIPDEHEAARMAGNIAGGLVLEHGPAAIAGTARATGAAVRGSSNAIGKGTSAVGRTAAAIGEHPASRYVVTPIGAGALKYGGRAVEYLGDAIQGLTKQSSLPAGFERHMPNRSGVSEDAYGGRGNPDDAAMPFENPVDAHMPNRSGFDAWDERGSGNTLERVPDGPADLFNRYEPSESGYTGNGGNPSDAAMPFENPVDPHMPNRSGFDALDDAGSANTTERIPAAEDPFDRYAPNRSGVEYDGPDGSANTTERVSPVEDPFDRYAPSESGYTGNPDAPMMEPDPHMPASLESLIQRNDYHGGGEPMPAARRPVPESLRAADQQPAGIGMNADIPDFTFEAGSADTPGLTMDAELPAARNMPESGNSGRRPISEAEYRPAPPKDALVEPEINQLANHSQEDLADLSQHPELSQLVEQELSRRLGTPQQAAAPDLPQSLAGLEQDAPAARPDASTINEHAAETQRQPYAEYNAPAFDEDGMQSFSRFSNAVDEVVDTPPHGDDLIDKPRSGYLVRSTPTRTDLAALRAAQLRDPQWPYLESR